MTKKEALKRKEKINELFFGDNLSLTDIGKILDVSRQRVHQILRNLKCGEGGNIPKAKRKEIRKRDKKCVHCKTYKKNMVIHHIDQNKRNNSSNNLMLVCRSCHTKIHNALGIKPQE